MAVPATTGAATRWWIRNDRDVNVRYRVVTRPGPHLAAVAGVPADVKRFVYVLQSLSQPDRQFVESAADVPTRVAIHNAGHSPLTAACRPWRLVAVVQFAGEPAALRFEKFLKTSAGRTLARQYFVKRDEG